MPTILIVDDEADIRQLLRLYLQNENYLILEAANGEEALELVQQQPIDLMVLDVMMPVRDGFSTVQALRQANYMFPVLMLTAKQEDLDKIQGLTFGADDYIGKPFNPLEVIARIKAMLRRVAQSSAALGQQPASRSVYLTSGGTGHLKRDNPASFDTPGI
ncbi:response regulator transcription factor [Exiguobacterium artemiae]|uniref:response regulator transcription factor n=1 Tax=Exiguobacterium artemiae TaxID=340145 RepID=UPI00068777C6|nr:response regulator [Exiguobacterium sibiricum]